MHMKKIIKATDILLPKKNFDYSKWAVVACDQYTSEPEYWDDLTNYVGDAVSTLNIIFPEVYLDRNADKRIEKINKTMKEYLENEIFYKLENSFVLVERTTFDGKLRLGLVLACDLEEYDFSPDSKAAIKATEGTVIDRLPPRVKIRENALLELPHIMLLMDNRKCDILEDLAKKCVEKDKLYDFELNKNGGRIKGYRISDTDEVISKIYGLADEKLQMETYGRLTDTLFTVGDGNHSLASAKICWDNLKKNLSEEEKENHPARFALVELINLHDENLVFEPINRVIFNITTTEAEQMTKDFAAGDAMLEMVLNDKIYTIKVPSSAPDAIAMVQDYIDKLIRQNNNIKVDYVHGNSNTLAVAKKGKGMAVLMPTLKKEELFGYIIEKGVLPRKSFSMGEANDKRYYLEAKLITPNKELK